jgi:putative nucleotidyltransferase with HDIG domain
VMRAFNDIPADTIDMQAFIRHSLACGMVARITAALKNMEQTEQLFISGLLHDIGKLIVFKYYPEQANACLRLAAASGNSVYHTEPSIIGLNHTHIGRYLLKKWRLPPDLETNIVYHHAPAQAPNPVKAGIVHLADLITHGLGIGGSGEIAIPCFDDAVLDKIGISNSTIQMVIRQAVHQLGPMEAIFTS